eukprot:UN02464
MQQQQPRRSLLHVARIKKNKFSYYFQASCVVNICGLHYSTSVSLPYLTNDV